MLRIVILISMKKSIATFILSIICIVAYLPDVKAESFRNETLHYVISYKWGLIHKDAGEATLTLKVGNNKLNATLSAKSKPWADKIFKVRDTLKSQIQIDGFKPLSYTKISHEGGKYGKDHIKYSYSGSNISAECSRIRIKNDKTEETKINLSSNRPAYDMLSIFYYLRQIDYDKLQIGQTIKATIFSGKRAETITIRNLGVETITLRNGSKRNAHHIRFNFTTQGNKKSSADMDTWISNDSDKIPLQLEGDLPIGKIKCYYSP